MQPPEPSEADMLAQLDRAQAWLGSPHTPERLAAINEMAAQSYQTCYRGSWAQPYLIERFRTDLTDDPDIRPGYAPNTWTAITNHLRRHGVTDDELIAVGLAKTATTSWQDASPVARSDLAASPRPCDIAPPGQRSDPCPGGLGRDRKRDTTARPPVSRNPAERTAATFCQFSSLASDAASADCASAIWRRRSSGSSAFTAATSSSKPDAFMAPASR